MTSRGMRQWSFSSRCCVNALQLSPIEKTVARCTAGSSGYIITGLYSYMEMNRQDEFGNIPEATIRLRGVIQSFLSCTIEVKHSYGLILVIAVSQGSMVSETEIRGMLHNHLGLCPWQLCNILSGF